MAITSCETIAPANAHGCQPDQRKDLECHLANCECGRAAETLDVSDAPDRDRAQTVDKTVADHDQRGQPSDHLAAPRGIFEFAARPDIVEM
jgi:hypothetical protein